MVKRSESGRCALVYPPGSLLPPLVGYATLFDRPSCRKENRRRLQFRPYAFDGFLATSENDVFAVLHHEDASYKFASWLQGSLLLDSDSVGVFIIALPCNNGNGRVAVDLVEGGHVNAMSIDVRWSSKNTTQLGDIDVVRRARLHEVSGVQSPAILGTSLQVGEAGRFPRTIEELLAQDIELRERNLWHQQQGTLGEFKKQKAAERAALLNQTELATAG
jgi:HK97 family phage prohead protease